MLYKITKQALGGKGSRIVIGADFVSNGHWAIKKEFIENEKLFSSVEVAEASFPGLQVSQMESGIAKVSPDMGQATALYLTHFLIDSAVKTLVRLYHCPQTGDLAGYNEAYLKFLGYPETLVAETVKGSAMDAAGHAFVIMPMTVDFGGYSLTKAAKAEEEKVA